MALPVNRPLKEWNLDTHLANITTSGATAVCFTPVPFIVVVTRVYGAQYAVVSGGASIVSATVNGGTPFATMTFTSGTAAGQVVTPVLGTDTMVPAQGVPVVEGDVISFGSDGGSADGTVACTFTAVLRRGI